MLSVENDRKSPHSAQQRKVSREAAKKTPLSQLKTIIPPLAPGGGEGCHARFPLQLKNTKSS
ncbi:MAG: hypothetical protein ACK6EB_18150, partial [Planctomyces sp.]